MVEDKSQHLLKQKQIIFERIEIIDNSLKDDDVKIKSRPLKAAIRFAENFVLEASGGGDKYNYTEQLWFAVIYYHSREWYDQTYGEQMTGNRDGFGHAVISVRGIPVAFDVPLTRSIVEKEGETAWLCFPIKIEDNEDPKTWLKTPPALSKLASEDLVKLENICTRTAVAMRKIGLNVEGLSGASEEINGYVTGIMPDVEAATAQILTNKPEGFGQAAWSMQMALEKTMKALGLQRNVRVKKTHDLFKLFDRVEGFLTPMRRDRMKQFLPSGEVMEARYGQGKAVEKDFIFKSFLAGIEFIAAATDQFKHSSSVGGGRILLQRPPWDRFG